MPQDEDGKANIQGAQALQTSRGPGADRLSTNPSYPRTANTNRRSSNQCHSRRVQRPYYCQFRYFGHVRTRVATQGMADAEARSRRPVPGLVQRLRRLRVQLQAVLSGMSSFCITGYWLYSPARH